jgi:hypothetical protein
MFTHVFDEMQRGFFDAYDKNTLWIVCRDREIAYESCETAVEAMTLIVRGFTIEYAHLECSDHRDWVVVARTNFELSRTIEYANKALMRLRHDEEWDEYSVKSDKLEQQARNLWEVARALSQLRMSV